MKKRTIWIGAAACVAAGTAIMVRRRRKRKEAANNEDRNQKVGTEQEEDISTERDPEQKPQAEDWL